MSLLPRSSLKKFKYFKQRKKESVLWMVYVTVGLCVHNGAKSVCGAIKSIADQNFPHDEIELFIVNDGSTDNTLKVISDYVQKLTFKVKVFSTPWRGLGPARNIIVNNAAGKYIVWVDSDIRLTKHYLIQQYEFMEANQTVGIAGGTVGLLDHKNLVAYLENLGFTVYSHRKRRRDNLPGTGGAICRVKALRQIGGFDEKIKGSGEDIDLAYRIKLTGWVVVRDKALFYAGSKSSWKSLWKKYCWHGFGAHYVLHKDMGIISLVMMSPIVTLSSSIFSSINAYKIVRKRIVFLLPIHALFKNLAWWFGYYKGHFEKYFP
jgi:glycosyltransferase involved in cell wall biosynthesis